MTTKMGLDSLPQSCYTHYYYCFCGRINPFSHQGKMHGFANCEPESAECKIIPVKNQPRSYSQLTSGDKKFLLIANMIQLLPNKFDHVKTEQKHTAFAIVHYCRIKSFFRLEPEKLHLCAQCRKHCQNFVEIPIVRVDQLQKARPLTRPKLKHIIFVKHQQQVNKPISLIYTDMPTTDTQSHRYLIFPSICCTQNILRVAYFEKNVQNWLGYGKLKVFLISMPHV